LSVAGFVRQQKLEVELPFLEVGPPDAHPHGAAHGETSSGAVMQAPRMQSASTADITI